MSAPLRHTRRLLSGLRPIVVRLDASIGRMTIRPRLGLAGSESRPLTVNGRATPDPSDAPDRAGVGGLGELDEDAGSSAAAAAMRLSQVAALIGRRAPDPQPRLGEALADLGAALDGAELPPLTVGWLAWVATRAAYPTEQQHERVTLRLELGGRTGLVDWIRSDLATQLRSGRGTERRLHIIQRRRARRRDRCPGRVRPRTVTTPRATTHRVVGRWWLHHGPTLVPADGAGGVIALERGGDRPIRCRPTAGW